MSCLREEEICSYKCCSSEGSLYVEYHTPGFERDDYASYERPEGGADECPGEEPSHCCGAFCGAVDISYASGADGEKGGSFESGEDTEDEIGGEVWRECCSKGAAAEEERCY